MRLRLLGRTVINWPEAIDMLRDYDPVAEIDAARTFASEAHAWSVLAHKVFGTSSASPERTQFLFGVEATAGEVVSVVAALSNVQVASRGDRYHLVFQIGAKELADAVRRLSNKSASKDSRCLGNALFEYLYKFYSEETQTMIREPAGDGTWYLR